MLYEDWVSSTVYGRLEKEEKILEVETLIASYYTESKFDKCLHCNDRKIYCTGGMNRTWFAWSKRGRIKIVEWVFNLENRRMLL